MIRKIAYKVIIIMLLAIVLLPAYTSDNFLKKGYINNDRGDKCWYTQETDFNSQYFHGTHKGRIGIITFVDPRCMSELDFGLDINKMMINNVISRWYSYSDAAFMTSIADLYPSSMLQKKGQCIQSAKYPIIGITIDYEIKDNSIIKVRHGTAIHGCKK